MQRPLEYLNNYTEYDWLIDYNDSQFQELAAKLYLELTPLLTNKTAPKIILAEREPVRFLAGFIAACAAGCPVFLCNPDWGKQEWQQVFSLVQPDIIWGMGHGNNTQFPLRVRSRLWRETLPEVATTRHVLGGNFSPKAALGTRARHFSSLRDATRTQRCLTMPNHIMIPTGRSAVSPCPITS